MPQHAVGTRDEWLSARRELLVAEKEHRRHGDELARRRRDRHDEYEIREEATRR